MTLPFPTLAVCLLLALAFGYGLQRGRFCAVACVDALLRHGRARPLLALLQASLWVVVVTAPFLLLSPMPWPTFPARTTVSMSAVAGGLLFGLAAAANGGCAFGTVTRLAQGDLSFLATLAGLAVGGAMMLTGGLGPEGAALGPGLLQPPAPAWLAPLAAALLLVGALALVEAGAFRLSGPEWPAERSVAVVGLSGGILMVLAGPWHYTMLFDQAHWSAGASSPPWVVLALLVAVVLGAALAASPAWKRARVGPGDAVLRLGAGVVMGAGAALVPGGNDGLLLVGIPSGSPHALAAFAAMIAGITIALLLRTAAERLWTGRLQRP